MMIRGTQYMLGGELRNYFMSLIFRYVHYPLYNLCFCFFLLPFKQRQGFYFVLWKNMEKRKKNTKKEIFITDIS